MALRVLNVNKVATGRAITSEIQISFVQLDNFVYYILIHDKRKCHFGVLSTIYLCWQGLGIFGILMSGITKKFFQ